MKKVTKIEESEEKEKVSELICKNRFCKFKMVKQIKMSIRKGIFLSRKLYFYDFKGSNHNTLKLFTLQFVLVAFSNT